MSDKPKQPQKVHTLFGTVRREDPDRIIAKARLDREQQFLKTCVQRHCPASIYRACMNPSTLNFAGNWLVRHGFSIEWDAAGALFFYQNEVALEKLPPFRVRVFKNSPLTP